jgi:hypothetical protein
MLEKKKVSGVQFESNMVKINKKKKREFNRLEETKS